MLNKFNLKSKNNKWKSKYSKKNLNKPTFFLYKKLKIKKYLNQFFKLNGLIVHNITIKITKTCLFLFVSYYNLAKLNFILNNINYNQKIKQIKKNNRNNIMQQKNLKNKKRLKLIKSYKNILNIAKFQTKNKFEKNSFIKKLLKGIKIFSKKQILTLTTQNLNKELFFKLKNLEIKQFKKAIFFLRQNSKYLFFKESINVLLIVMNKKKSSKFLCDYISYELHKTTKIRQHVIFLTFLEKVLLSFFKTNFCKINGIKIIIKGKLNGRSRTKKYKLLIGKIPENSLNLNVDYNKATTFSTIGTFGIKALICEK